MPFRYGFHGLVDNQIRHAGPLTGVESAPVLICTDHIFSRDLAQFFQSAVPVNHVVIKTDDEGRDRQPFDDAEDLLLAFVPRKFCDHAFGNILQGFNRTDNITVSLPNQRGREAQPAPLFAEIREKTVSYTHLTLPTT